MSLDTDGTVTPTGTAEAYARRAERTRNVEIVRTIARLYGGSDGRRRRGSTGAKQKLLEAVALLIEHDGMSLTAAMESLELQDDLQAKRRRAV